MSLGEDDGWSTQDRNAAREEAQRRFGEWLDHPRMDRFGEGCINGFQLGAEWWKAMHPATRPVCPKHAHIGHSAELPCYWCSDLAQEVVDAATRAWSAAYHRHAAPHDAMRAALRAAEEAKR